jgi:hypothetical protein
METLYSAHEEAFQMDEQCAFEMEDDYGFYEDLDSDEECDTSVGTGGMMTPLPSGSDEESSVMSIPVCSTRIEDEDIESLSTSPPILTPFMVDAIAEEGLPWSMQDTQWDRLFASSRDGTSFGTFLRRVRGHGQTIIVAKTSDGKIVGGYATDVWSGRKQGSQDGHSFLFMVEPPSKKGAQPRAVTPTTFIPGLEEFGTSPTSAFDFDLHEMSLSSSPHKVHDGKPHVEIFKTKHLANAAKLSNKLISMCDESGNLSLNIENFSCGNTSTRENDREEFKIVEFEVYGFSED